MGTTSKDVLPNVGYSNGVYETCDIYETIPALNFENNGTNSTVYETSVKTISSGDINEQNVYQKLSENQNDGKDTTEESASVLKDSSPVYLDILLHNRVAVTSDRSNSPLPPIPTA